MWKCVVFLLCTFAILVQSEDGRLTVNIAQGAVVGHMDPEGGLYVFYNIPYATAPTGTNRFKAPLPAPVFLSPFVAVDRSIACPQPVFPTSQLNVLEDCLVANVYVPDKDAANLPVLVIVHGGAYQYGFGELEKFRELAKTKRVIVVTFNYRLGVHGFLCLGTEGAPGNAGLKDQVALLRWVNTNIANFGGNPEDVTLAGCSAGSGSIDFLTLSSITKGLFKKAIMESGVSTGGVGVQIDPIENAKDYAKLLGFSNGNDLSSLEDFYKTSTFETLLSQHGAITNQKDVTIRFGPCVESDIGHERVVSDAPISIIQQGNYTKTPLMYGFTNMDGAMRLNVFSIWKDKMNEKFSDFLPSELHFDSEIVKEEVAQKVKAVYFEDKPVSEDNIRAYITYFTDVLFGYPMLRSLSTRVEALDDTIFLFEYSFVDKNTLPFPNTDITGAGHCYQFIAVMDEDVTGKTDEYKKMKETLREYWHTFILNGSPTSSDTNLPKWQPADAKRSPHMSLGPVKELKDNILGERAAFWDTIYEEHYRGPVIPVTSTPTPATTETTTTKATTTEATTTEATTTEATTTEATTTEAPTTEAITTEATTAEATTTEDTTADASATDTTTADPTTAAPTTPETGSGSAVSISKFMFVVVSLSFYFTSY